MIDVAPLMKALASPSAPLARQSALVEAMNELLTPGGISTKLRLAHWFAQAAHECMGFSAMAENLNYGAEGLRKTWPGRFPSLDFARRYARNPEAIANVVYADRLGNGTVGSGDGWKYRGRGIFQLTGKANYEDAGKAIGVDIVDHPEMAAEPETAVKVAIYFWNAKKLNAKADMDNIRSVTQAVNGGLIGLDDRMARLRTAKHVLGI